MKKYFICLVILLLILAPVGCRKKIKESEDITQNIVWDGFANKYYEIKYPGQWEKVTFANQVKFIPGEVSEAWDLSVKLEKVETEDEFHEYVEQEVERMKKRGTEVEEFGEVVGPGEVTYKLEVIMPEENIKGSVICAYKNGAAFKLSFVGKEDAYNGYLKIGQEMMDSFTISDFESFNFEDKRAKPDVENYQIEVRGLVLKYALIDTASEIYYTQGRQYYKEAQYTGRSSEIYNHYKWLTKTYNSFTPEMKENLATIYDNIHQWQLMNVTTKLKDEARLKEIMKAVNFKLSNLEVRKAAEEFYPYFYNNFFKFYFEQEKDKYEKRAAEINREIADKDINVLNFMERVSGIEFKQKYKPVFYYILHGMSNYGFEYGDHKISTISRGTTSYKNLLGTPFHEFSHPLFQTFTRSPEFKEVAEELKQDQNLKQMWENGADRAYDWVGWCEENLVEGFAKYLAYKYYGYEEHYSSYIYDHKFYEYLRKIDFSGDKISLKKVSIDFYERMLEGQ